MIHLIQWLLKNKQNQSQVNCDSDPTKNHSSAWQHRAQSPRQRSGASGEELAKVFLIAQGLTHVHSNIACPMGEIDLVMRDGATWVFVEVKMRQGAAYGGAVAALTPAKLKRFEHMALWYLQEFVGNAHAPCRLDAVCIQGAATQPQIEWLQNISQ